MNGFPTIVAFDVETATFDRYSICEIGIAVIVDNQITQQKSWLIQPPRNEYDEFNTYIHGIGPKDTENKPFFPEVWTEVVKFLTNNIVVCHYSAFDMGALQDALDYYELPYPVFDIMCTVRVSKKTIPGLSSYSLGTVYENLFGEKMENHHRAQADACACARILIECLKIKNVNNVKEYEEAFILRIGHISPEDYRNQLAKCNSSYHKIAKEIIGDSSKNDINSYFYEKKVCFTGTFSFAPRRELMQYIADIGGQPMSDVTKTIDILVVGLQDFKKVGESGMSSKQKKASKYIENGLDIEIMSEEDFLSLAGHFRKSNPSNTN